MHRKSQVSNMIQFFYILHVKIMYKDFFNSIHRADTMIEVIRNVGSLVSRPCPPHEITWESEHIRCSVCKKSGFIILQLKYCFLDLHNYFGT